MGLGEVGRLATGWGEGEREEEERTRTVFPAMGHTRFLSPGRTGPHLHSASLVPIKSISNSVGILASIFPGVFNAGIGYERIYMSSGNSERCLSETTKKVPFDMYRFLNTVHPGACSMISVSGMVVRTSTGTAAAAAAGGAGGAG